MRPTRGPMHKRGLSAHKIRAAGLHRILTSHALSIVSTALCTEDASLLRLAKAVPHVRISTMPILGELKTHKIRIILKATLSDYQWLTGELHCRALPPGIRILALRPPPSQHHLQTRA